MSKQEQYAPEHGTSRGFAKIVLSRQGACGGGIPPAAVTVRIGPVAVVDKQPALASVTEERQLYLPACKARTVLLRPPPGPWRVEAEVAETFVPAELDAGSGDRRELGAVVSFQLVD